MDKRTFKKKLKETLEPKSPLEFWLSKNLQLQYSYFNAAIYELAIAINEELQSIKTQLRLLDKEGVLKDENH